MSKSKLEVFEAKITERFVAKGRNLSFTKRIGDFRLEGSMLFSSGENIPWWVVLKDNALYGSTDFIDEAVRLSDVSDFEALLLESKRTFVEEYVKEAVVTVQPTKRPKEVVKYELIHIQRKYQSYWFVVRFDHDTVRALRKCSGYLLGTPADNPRIQFVEGWLSAYGDKYKVAVPYKGHVHGVTSIRMD